MKSLIHYYPMLKEDQIAKKKFWKIKKKEIPIEQILIPNQKEKI